MKVQYLIVFLIFGMFTGQGWAPPPGQGGAAAAPDIKSCDLKPREQTKVMIKDKKGETHYICVGQAVCGGRTVPVSCKVSEKELCPTAKVCIEYMPPKLVTRLISCKGNIKLNIKSFKHVTVPTDIEFQFAPGCRIYYTGSGQKDTFMISGHLTGDANFTGENEGKENLQYRLFFGTKGANSDPDNSLQIWHMDIGYQLIVFPLTLRTPPYYDIPEFKGSGLERKFLLKGGNKKIIEKVFPKPEGGTVRVMIDMKEKGIEFEATGIPSPSPD